MSDLEVDSLALSAVAETLSWRLSTMAGRGELSEDPGVGFPANRSQLAVIAGEAFARFERSRAILDAQLVDLRLRAESVAERFPALDVDLARGES